jgi:hypothetical protein
MAQYADRIAAQWIAGFVRTTTTRTIQTESTDGDELTHTLRLWLKSPIDPNDEVNQ